MQSGGGTHQGWNAGPPSPLASPSSTVSAPSGPHLGFDSIQQQKQQRQLLQDQSLQRQLLRKPEGNEAIPAYTAGSRHGILSGGSLVSSSGGSQHPEQSKKFIDLGKQQVASHFWEEGHNRSQGIEQQVLNPVHQPYLQYSFQAAQQKSAPGIQAKMGMVGPLAAKDQDMRMGNLRMQELMPIHANNQAQSLSSKKPLEHTQQAVSNQRIGSKPPPTQATSMGQLMQENMIRPMLAPEAQQSMANNRLAMAAQMEALARERNIDLSIPSNAHLMAQLIPLLQSRMITQQKAHENSMQSSSPVSLPKQQIASLQVSSVSSPRGNSSNDPTVNNPNNSLAQQISFIGRENQVPQRQTMMFGNGMGPITGFDHSSHAKSLPPGLETSQVQNSRQSNRSSPKSTASSVEGGVGNAFSAQGGVAPQMQQEHTVFTKQQLHVLKAQILAFRRLKKGDVTLPQELLRSIAPPPLETQLQQVFLPSGTVNQDRLDGENAEDSAKQSEASRKDPEVLASSSGKKSPIVEGLTRDEKAALTKEPVSVFPSGKEEQQPGILSVKPEQEVERGNQKTLVRSEFTVDREKTVTPQISDTTQAEKPVQATNPPQQKDVGSSKKYHGPLYDFPHFTRKPDYDVYALRLGYEVKDLLLEEGIDMLSKRRAENSEKISGLLAVNLERKRIRPDLVLQLQIEAKKLRLLDLQSRLRDEVNLQQKEIMGMPDRPYRKFVRLCERQRVELTRQVQASQKAIREKQLKSIFQWRKKLLEAHWAIRDARTARNRGVAKHHEKMLREFSKTKDDDRNKRMEALKNNDVERYREMLLEQQTSISGDASERYAVLSSFLTQTEEYLHKMGSKITATKNQQEVEEAVNAAANAARAQGLSDEEVRAAAACAGEEVMIRNHFSKMNAPKNNSSINKYYNLAHAVNERVIRQPSMLRAGTLRDYQLVGLQWMLSLYNNKLNGILADEMGLGKTVQVMALIAYLMEFKGNYGPHLIIVPNAVLVNWKSELHKWLPSVSCIYYVGVKDQRSKLFSQEVSAMKFNILVTTYEFIMFDRSKLSKVDWKYIIIDEAQRMKDRESVLARDLDRYRCQRRLLLTGTPLQNDLKELWSLLNLLLPEVFDNRKAFHDWFSQPFQKDGPTHNTEDDWLETEKKVIIIHRLHQILEPFMLRRRVEDVEGSLPPKVSIVLRCRMSAIQSSIYDWIKSTGTLRVDPEDEERRVQKNPSYQAKTYKPLNNRCMELRKTCNHPLLNYPYFNNFSKDFLVRSCGKLWVLDRILIKLQRTGHRVLLFSTMTKLLDLLEEYLQWRRLVYRRIDGTTSLEDRESAIIDFSSPNTDCFIFLLSIRAAGRGLNLQTADTVIIYDPDPNPKNEEQAVARAHRIGQTREVKVIYMEAVVDKIASHQKEDEFQSGGLSDSEDDLVGKDRYIGSIEGLIRNNIQQYKIDMADEVINAGRFDQRTTHEERRLTLETLLHDEERYQETVHNVPSLQEVNRMIARSEEEVELFDQMDEVFDWTEEMTSYGQVPQWLRVGTREVNATIASLSKKPSKKTLLGGSIAIESSEVASDVIGKKRGRSTGKNKLPSYRELEEENGEFSGDSSEERNGYAGQEEEGEIGEYEDVEFSGAIGEPPNNNNQSEEESTRNDKLVEEAGSSGSSLDSQKMPPQSEELEEGEIAMSGDSHLVLQQSRSGIQYCDEGEGDGEQVLQPKIKRKRSIRVRSRHTMEGTKGKYSIEKPSLHGGNVSQLPSQVDYKYEPHFRNHPGLKVLGEPKVIKPDHYDSSLKSRQSMPLTRITSTSKARASLRSIRLNSASAPSEDAAQHSRESWDGKVMNTSGTSIGGSKMSDVIQRRCKTVISRFQRKIDKEGHEIVPLLTDLWKRIENSVYLSGAANSLLDLRKIGQRVERVEYNGVMELVFDVQFMLKSAMQYFGFSQQVRTEAKKVHDLFFKILNIAFSDTDFQEAKNALSFSSPVATSTSASSLRQEVAGPSKPPKLIKEVDPDPSPPQRPLSRGPVSNIEDKKTRIHVPQKDDLRLLTHPGELVICKKKRNEREKCMSKPGNGSPGPVSPPSIGHNIQNPGPGPGLTRRETRSSQRPTNQPPQQVMGGGAAGEVSWANPVKRLRTDAGKRRPSHL
ncbi:ATP-dependent helicase BRM-like isoform X2 [Rhododendron vialii]|uniref:ATP-dependent helicase BRM-like isoform X2 n=1 Tax=Rhododendron vialii TaxID=182163 RepID=UPI00265FAADB|nr:ATP-dependent helicase BRM-like isoform X2 [Rhododendron vialii]